MTKTWKWQGITFKKTDVTDRTRHGFPLETEWKATARGADWVTFKFKDNSYWFAAVKTANLRVSTDGKKTRGEALWELVSKMRIKVFKYHSELAEYETALEDVKDA